MLNKNFNSINIYEKALNASWAKNQVISNNIANVNTPGYKRQDVKFESILKESIKGQSFTLSKTHPKHLPLNGSSNSIHQIVEESNTSFRRDKNNVNIDVEMAELSKNTIKFNSLVQQISSNLRRLRMAVTDGRK